MNHGPDIPDFDQPPAAELERVRLLLVGLGTERAPADVTERLQRVLDAALPAPGAGAVRRRRSPWLRRALLGAVPVAAVVAAALVVMQSPSDDATVEQAAQAPAAAEALSSAAPAAGDAIQPTGTGAEDGAVVETFKSEAVPSREAIRDAGREAHREALRLLIGSPP